MEDYEVCYIAYTGKATQVLREKGCKTVSTAHKLLYKAEKVGTSYIFTPFRFIPIHYMRKFSLCQVKKHFFLIFYSKTFIVLALFD